jgi:outer membrane protein assembly factor BamB
MKKIVHLSISGLLSLAMPLSTIGQEVKETWTKTIAAGLNWQKVYNSGTYIVNTHQSLSGVNPNNGEIIWSHKQFGPINTENMDELEGSSLLQLKHNNAILFIDPFSGEIKFNSETAGVQEIIRQKVLSLSNTIFIAGKDATQQPILLLVDITNGEIKWKLNEKFGSVISIQEINPKEFLLVTVFNNYKMETNTGKVIWKNAISDEAERANNMKGGLGAFVKDIANAVVDQSEIKITFYQHPSNEYFVIGSESSEQKQVGTEMTTIFKNTYQAFRMDNGARIWKKPISLEGKISKCDFYNDNFIAMPDNNRTSTINMFSLFDGSGKWGKKGKGTKVKGGVINYNLGNELIVVTNDNNKNMLYIIDINTGLPMFKKPIRISGEVVQTYKTNLGILYVTTNEVNLVNPNSGLLMFKNSLSSQPSLCKVNDGKLYVFNQNDLLIYTVDLQNGTLNTLSKSGLKTQGKESFKDMEIRENGVFLSSDQNVALVDFNGNTTFNNYFPAPKESGLKQALLYAQAARAAYISVRATQVANAFHTSAQGTNNATGKDMMNKFGDAYADYGNQAASFAAKSLQQANARYKATAQGRDFVIVLSEQEDGYALLKVNKNNGVAEGKVNLGKDKNPKYTVDDVTGQIFLEGKKGTIISYKLSK